MTNDNNQNQTGVVSMTQEGANSDVKTGKPNGILPSLGGADWPVFEA